MPTKLPPHWPAVRRCILTGTAGLALLGAGLPTAADDGDGDGPGLSRFYDQKISWSAKACESPEETGRPEGLQCGKVTVPLDYAHPNAGKLELALARYRATGKSSRGSVVLNFGGPGGSGVAELSWGADDFMDLAEGYDVVSFDPRGVGRSSPVSCGDTGYETAVDLDGTDDALSDPQAVLRKLRKVAKECAAHSGPVLEHMGTVDVSRDLDIIRDALGDKKLNYLGFSYGTRLAAVYAAQFPHKVGRLVLDGVDTLTEPLTEQGIVGARGQQVALDAFIDWCVKDIACPFGQDARSAREDVVRLVHSLDEDPVPTAYNGPFSGQDLVGAIGQALYSEDLWPSLERALASLVEDGDTRAIEAFAGGGIALPVREKDTREKDTEAGEETGGTLVDEEDVPLDNLPAALMAVNCADDPDRPTAGQITRDLARLRADYERASPVFGVYRLTQVLMCHGRPKGTDFIREKVKNVDTPKMLLVGTRGDPATPYRWTVETAKRLGSSAVVLDHRGEGHTGYGSSTCVHRKVDDFLLYGSLPADGSSCGPDRDR
ncbi:pimeloyl-ACP methyl ester carboxylesterase [Streptomyces sp. SAI-170]|uniref:alpha/beta hydrolase n=1 Tax=Streptomyces sp. SAI-170 TaxID=3377729 RepID=UPI003C7C9915